MKSRWKRWISGFIAALLILTNVPVQAFAYMGPENSGKPTSITTAEGTTVPVEESWEEVYPYGAFLFTESEAALTEGGEEKTITLYRLGGTDGRATVYVMYAPVVTQLTEERTSYGSAAGYGDVEIFVEDELPIAKYQPVGKDPEPYPCQVRILEKEADGEEAEASDRVLYLGGSAENCQWYILAEGSWKPVEGATDAEFLVSKEMLEEFDFRCVFSEDGRRVSTDSFKGVPYVRPEEEILPDLPEDLELNPEKSFTQVPLDAENPYAAKLLALTFADGEWAKEIRVKAPENEVAQPLRFGTFTILEHSGGDIFQEASLLTLQLKDNDTDDPYTIRFAETKVTADSSEGTAVLRLRREGGGQVPVTVDYATVDGTAAAGKDYEKVSGTAVFYADVDEVTIEIPLLQNGESGEAAADFRLVLGELKGDSEGLCTLADREAVITLTHTEDAGEEEAEENAGDLPQSLEEEAEIPGHDLPGGGLAGAFRDGTEVSGEPLSGEQVVTPGEDLLYGRISGLEGKGGGGPLRTFVYGQISFSGAHGGQYWGDRATIAGQSSNTLSGWSGGSAYGSGWQIKKSTNASAVLKISYMPQMYSGLYGRFEFNAGLDNGWHFTNGYAYGWAGVYKSDNSLIASASSNPKLSTEFVSRHLSWNTSGTINTSWDMETNVQSVQLKITKVKNESKNDVYSRITDGYLTRRVLDNKLNLRIHTANDGDSDNGNVPTAPDGAAALHRDSGVYNNMKPEVLVEENAGGVDTNGRLYVGSKLKITLRNTDSYEPYSGDALNSSVYVSRADGRIVNAKVEAGNNGIFYVTMLWDGMTEQDLSDTYFLNIVMTRKQKLELNLSPSVERMVNPDGSVSMEIDPNKIGDAWEEFWKNGDSVITVGYSRTIPDEPYFDANKIDKHTIVQSEWESGDQNPLKILGTFENIQYINFNRGSRDQIIFNGKVYRGDENIFLGEADLAYQKITFSYYSEKFLEKPGIMNASINRVELYFDGDGDGRIAGSYNDKTGYFTLDSDTQDTFEMYLEEDGNYDEVMFQPIELENGKYGQYFAKVFYTMTPRSLIESEGFVQVLPAVTTSRTNDKALASLTDEQTNYRYLLSGADRNGVRTSDNHPMYGAKATAYQFVDIPLGGDRSPLREIAKDQYEWDPRYVGNLIYDFSSPEPIYIEHSLAGDNYPLAEVTYQDGRGIQINSEGRENLNGYLGSFVADTTLALCVTEQRLTSDELHRNPVSVKNLKPESSVLSRRSATPNGAWLTQVDSGDMGSDSFNTADSGQEFSEFNVDYGVDLPVTNESFQGLATVITGKNSINILISVPIYSRSGGKNKFFPKTVTDPLGSTVDQLGAYKKSMKDGSYDEIEKALERGGSKKNSAGRLESSKVSGTVSFTAIFSLKYDTAENSWYLQEFVFGAAGALNFKYDVRLAACPLVYGFISVNAALSITTGGTIFHKIVESKTPLVTAETPKKLAKGESLPFSTPYINANIEFSGKILIKTDAVGGEKVNNGYLKSEGGKKIQLQFKNSKSSMTFDKDNKKRTVTIVALEDTTINYLNPIEKIESELTWSGVKLAPKIIAEIGVGAGVEGLKVEAFIKSMVSAGFTFGKPKADGSRKGATVDNANFKLSIALRAVFLMTTWEIDAIGVKAVYDGKEDKWTTSYVAWGKDHTLNSTKGLAGADDGTNTHLPKAIDETQTIYSSQTGAVVRGQSLHASENSSGLLRAYTPDDPNVPFQLSGYNSSAEAFRLADGLELGCDYRVVTVKGEHYVVYTIGRPGGKGMDTTMLALSRLVLTGEGYGQNVGVDDEDDLAGNGLGLINPFDWKEITDEEGKTHRVVKAPNERSETPYILVDLKKDARGELVDDGAGDLEFDVRVIGNRIEVAWISYAVPEPNPSSDSRLMMQNAAVNTVVRRASCDVTMKEGFSEAEDLSASGGGNAVYSPRIVNDTCTVYVRTNHADAEKRAELVGKYIAMLNGLGYYADRGSDAGRSIFEYRLAMFENVLDYKGVGSTLCVYKNGQIFEFASKGGSEDGCASDEPILPIDKLAVFEKDSAGAGTDLYAAYTTWQENLNAVSEEELNISGLYLTSFKVSEEGVTCPRGHAAVSSDFLDPTRQNDTLLVYEGRASDSGTTGQAAETLLLVGQAGKVFLIPSGRIDSFLRAKGAEGSGSILEKTAFSGGDDLARTGFAFGGDGDGNLVAVYISTVRNTTNTGIYLSVFDPASLTWGGGTLLAMRHMDVYEDAAKYSWSDEDAEKAYLGGLDGYSDGEGRGRGGMDQFQFSNLQIALGVKPDVPEDQNSSAATDFTGSNTTLTILTQGMMRYLTYKESGGQSFLMPGAEPPAGAPFKEGLGVYAISYGVGHQSIGQASLSFVNGQFTSGSLLTANLSFINTGDIGIRGSEDNPITVTLSVDGEGVPPAALATWKVTDNIYPGRKVELTGDFTLPVTLPGNAGFCLSVSEDDTYAEDPYSASLKDIYTVKGSPELDFMASDIALSVKDNGILALNEQGDTILDVDLFVGNRGIEDVENAYIKFSYGVHDPGYASQIRELQGEGSDWNDMIYLPLDITGHHLKVGEEELLRGFSKRSGGGLSEGILNLGGIRAGYGRHVRGTLTVSADTFAVFGENRTNETAGSLKLVAEIFSGGEADADPSGQEEYSICNNRSETVIGHTTAFSVPGHLEVPVGTQLRLPVFFSTTLSTREPDIDIVELMDREIPAGGGSNDGKSPDQRTDVLTWKRSDYQNGQGLGTLVMRGAETGLTYVRIQDSKTNSYTDIAVLFTEAAQGLDITNTNEYFTFYNPSGDPDTGGERAWVFRENISSWRNNEKPLNGDLALGSVGASFTFTTEAEAIAVNFQGEITVSADFPGFEPVTIEDGGKMRMISFGANRENLPHTVTITVSKEAFPGTDDSCAYFDRLIEYYAGDQADPNGIHEDDLDDLNEWKDAESFNLIWETNFPEPASLNEGQSFETTVYGVIDGIMLRDALNHVTCTGDNVEVLSTEYSDRGSYGQRFSMKLRFTGNGPAIISLENDKHGACHYTVNADWWKPETSAFASAGDPVYQAYAEKYPDYGEKMSAAAASADSRVPVSGKWMHAEPADCGNAITVRIDDDAPAETFEIRVADYEEYLETNRFPEGDAIVLRRGEKVTIPFPENSEALVRAEAVKNKGENPALNYTIKRNDGSVEQYNAEDSYYINTEVVYVPETEDLICFKAQSLALSGKIGVNFYMNLPEIAGVDYSESYVEFTVCGEMSSAPYDENARSSDGAYYRFTCFVNAVQMADEIKAVFHYRRDGEKKTIEKTYSVKQYIEDFDGQRGFDERVTTLVHALADYGHYAQPYLSELRGWEIGADHLEMDRFYKEGYSAADIAAARKNLTKWAINCRKPESVDVSYSLYLDTGTGIYLYFTITKGKAGNVSATVDGSPAKVTKMADGKYRVGILDVAAHRLGRTYSVKFKSAAGTTSVDVSALSYVGSALKKTGNEDKTNSMMALYNYYAAAEEYLKNS